MSMELFVWGANSHGQLGLGYQSEQIVDPERLNLSKLNINVADIKCIVGGAGHTLILEHSGRLFGCGWNKASQVGLPNNKLDAISNFGIINNFHMEKIIDIACGWNHSFALTDCGEIYGWGSNQYGQLGLKQLHCDNSIANKYISVPIKIKIEFKVKKIAAGLRHSAVISDDGRVFVTGSGNKYQLGLVDSNTEPILSTDTFTPVPGIENIIDIACGQYFTIALAGNGDIFTWGNNKYGQLGVDSNEIPSSILPIKLEMNFGEVKMISAGWTHANVLNNEGIIFAWGRNTYGQLGNGLNDIYQQWQPKIVQTISNIRQLSVGSEHNIALDDEGRIYSWGWNEHGNCGNGDVTNIFSPCEILNRTNNNTALLIGSGAAHSFAIIKNTIDNE
ncbi:hypothetical protein PV328_011549 [Microctonus aethiopoides]|uniref:RCC1-like domain-containing protein n=1 Tax=Microctonus aethiopoides TaxID=144406 RepID=A0AA39EW40_9HYME|nr:hypothetical protein PV328_011549 [Microctonus aethiopoides]